MPSVGYIRPEVTRQTAKWALISDCLNGEEAVKAKGAEYLPKPNDGDDAAARERYDAYKKRAVFYNVTRRTLDGLVGQVFHRDPQVEIPDEMDVLLVDVDGAGVGLDQQAKKALSLVLSFGRCGLLADYPPVEGGVSLAEQEAGYVRPTITLYDADDVINWRTVTIGARRLLSLVVISENYVLDDDGFEATSDTQYRVLRLVPPPPPEDAPEDWVPEWRQAVYRVEIYRTTADNGHYIQSAYEPKDASGAPLREIPFTFVGALNNDPGVDHPPLYDLAALNIAHYRNSADYEESCFMVGQPTPFFAGLTQEWVETVMKGKILLGSRAAVPLPAGGSAGLLQAQPNSMPKEALEHKERQMVALGAKLVQPQQVQRTATEAGQDEASESSILASVARNVSRAYTESLNRCADFTGASFPMSAGTDESGGPMEEREIRFELNADFPASRMTAQDRAQLMAEWQGGGIAFSEYRSQLRAAGVAMLDDEAAKEEMANDPAKPGASFADAMDKTEMPEEEGAGHGDGGMGETGEMGDGGMKMKGGMAA